MTAELRRSLVLAGGGLVAGFALVLALFGSGQVWKSMTGGEPAVARLPDTAVPGPDDGKSGAIKPGDVKPGDVASGVSPAPQRSGEAGKDQPGKPRPAGEQIPAQPQTLPAAEAGAPTFDIIRVEPNGDSVIAGRGAPNTTVELMRDGEPIARALIDPSGQFAIVPPALPSGNSEITLRITGADGQVRRSRESVAVVVSGNRDAKPLIALSAPDRPTVVLSQPDPAPAAPAPVAEEAGRSPAKSPKSAEATSADAKSADAKSAAAKGAPGPEAGSAPKAAASTPEAPRPAAAPVKVVSVDAEEGGRLYVTGQASPGATVRLYLNDTLVAPGSAGADGRLAFAIGRGVLPGAYRVRIDEVDSVSGKVKARSEVAFAVPAAAPPKAASRPMGGGGPAHERDTVAVVPALPEAAAPAAGGADARRAAAQSVEPKVADPKVNHPKLADSKLAERRPPEGAQPPFRPAEPPRAETPAPGAPERPGAMARSDLAPAPAVTAPSRMPAPEKPGAESPALQAPALQIPAPGPTARPGAPERTVFIPEIGTARIARGDNLWQISRKVYGKGTRYTVIFDANQSQIRNPDLIYPGQIFVLPTDGAAAVRTEERRG
ncbi:LysM peptidoglycan-binding domain-containing protein [Methylobacterium sp. Leaf466]|uniref:LysM peptidoglycan-binding domain-containing protein n=1 Tax=Methylobacterium sp. Leaf466 TaxID=1736386 RepID=UPI0006FBBE1E|nr:LysM peptidoglycan-binding domain-containing protein [Methylobacterium sp. Leaf466]KQT80737.1 hypothetical protein ASG59_04760 [Methylobacterium sp. Leaf466]